MLAVGLTGGIGSGKSTFAVLLAERGAQVIDADQLGRDALRPGEPAWHSVVDTFGDEVLVAGSMEIDRKRLAQLVFTDPNKLTALNAITHPIIVEGIASRLERLRSTDEVVVIDAALMIGLGLDKILQAVIVVDADRDVRKDRLVRNRAMLPDDVEARMAAQLSPETLLEKADFVVHNDGPLENLVREADRAWEWLQEMDR